MPDTITRPLPSTRVTFPRLPLSRPAITITSSSRLSFCINLISTSCSFQRSLEHLGGQRNDSHEFLVAQLPGNRSENTSADWGILVVQQNRRIVIKLDERAVGATHTTAGTHHKRLQHLTLLHLSARDGFLDSHLDDVANTRVPAMGSAQHLDAHDTTGATVVRDLQIRLYLNHGTVPANKSKKIGSRAYTWVAFSSMLTSIQVLVFESGRTCFTVTRSPA